MRCHFITLTYTVFQHALSVCNRDLYFRHAVSFCITGVFVNMSYACLICSTASYRKLPKFLNFQDGFFGMLCHFVTLTYISADCVIL